MSARSLAVEGVGFGALSLALLGVLAPSQEAGYSIESPTTVTLTLYSPLVPVGLTAGGYGSATLTPEGPGATTVLVPTQPPSPTISLSVAGGQETALAGAGATTVSPTQIGGEATVVLVPA